jgi:ketosteroid isomerase-like protein
MKRILAVAVLAVVSSLGLGQVTNKQAKTTDSPERTVMLLESDWYEATIKKDTATIDKILADDWVVQTASSASTKAEAMDDLKSGNFKMESGTLLDLKARVFGDVVVVIGSDESKRSYNGKDTSGPSIWTDIFVKRQGRWQAVCRVRET